MPIQKPERLPRQPLQQSHRDRFSMIGVDK